ncbi:hypothetical protein [Solibacillus sp. FSL K6-1554]|uniref:hypothetical protein n=1 Tax=Solibacillus sp. FSL K6-1554 TaxID=2921472 RepID=UPI0030F5DC74
MQKKLKIIEDRKALLLAIALLIFIWIFFSVIIGIIHLHHSSYSLQKGLLVF